jgi:putative ABC transport system permease protein
MRALADLWFRLKALLTPGRMERELAEELAFHREMEQRKLEASGMAPGTAAREARRRFGSEVRERERVREAWGTGLIRDLTADLRFALRQMRRRPAFTVMAVVTLALGIGGTVALFGVVYGLLLRPLPVAHAGRVVVFWDDFDWRGVEYDFARERVQAYEGIAAYTEDGTSLRTDAGTSLLLNAKASSNLFDVLGVRPLLGRTFAPGEDRPGAEPVVVLSYGLWQQDLGGDPGILRRRILLGGVPTTVIGVMPRGFYFPTPEFRAWRPLELDPASAEYQDNGYLTLIGRVRPGVGEARLHQDVGALAAGLGQRFTYPEAWDKTKGAHVTPLRQYLLGDVRPALLLLLGAAGLLLIMACANVAALILGRTTDRGGEMAVRTALGAGRLRLARQVLAESVLLAALAGTLALALAAGVFRVLVASLPLQGEFGQTLSLDWTPLAVGLALVLLSGSAMAIVPIRLVLRGRFAGELSGERTEGGGVGGRAGWAGRAHGASRAHNGLVLAEVVLAVMLVTGAGLLVRTVARLQALDPGLDPQDVVVMDLVTGAGEMSQDGLRQFFDGVVKRVAAVPGVRSAGLTNRLPLRDGGWQGPVSIEGRPDLAGAKRPNSLWRTATPGYFRAMGIQLQSGRFFDDADRAGAAPVTVVSASFARRMWPGQDPLGKRIQTGFDGSDAWRTVVGVTGEVRMTKLVGENPMTLYVPQAQRLTPGTGNVLVVRTSIDPAAVIGPVRAAVHDMDSRVAIARVNTMDGVVADSIQAPLRLRFFLMLFAGLGLVLGAVGVYGVVSYSVTRRRSEFAIRMALGAAPRDVLRVVVLQGLAPVALGILGGLALSIGLSRLIAGFLYGVAPTDLVSLGAAAGILMLAALIAAAGPAVRAGRAHPVEALRAE